MLPEARRRSTVSNVLVGLGIGVGAGVLAGLFGIGGGIVIVPALVFLGLSQKDATGTSLAALVLPVGILGVIEYARRHEVHFRYAIGIAIGITLGALAGAILAGHLSNAVLRRAFGGVMLVVAFRFLLFKA